MHSVKEAIHITRADVSDAQEILQLQKSAYKSEAHIYNDYQIPPLLQTLDEIRSEFDDHIFLKAVHDDKIIGSVRATEVHGTCHIGRLIVAIEYQGRGLGTRLMHSIEEMFSVD